MRASEHPARHPPGYTPPQQQRPYRPENPEPEDLDEAESVAATSDNQIHSDLGERLVGYEPEPEPQPTREPIATVPKDGRDVRVYWGDEDEDGRLARWKHGRFFNGRRWIPGGRWMPSDEMTPLTMDTPTHWLKPVNFEESSDDQAA
jgi:hypothetical protein